MARRSPENPYQIPFDFTSRPDQSALDQVVHAGSLVNFSPREPGLGRFIRSVEHDAQIQTPSMAADFLLNQVFTPFDDFPQEELMALMLNIKNRITHAALIYRGTINSVHVRNAEIFRPAIMVNARSIMLAHNHPSGSAEPSPDDIRFSESCVEAGRILDIEVLDHIVVGRNCWVSLKERHLGFR